MNGIPRIQWEGDSALVVGLEEQVDAGINSRALAIAAAIDRAQVPGVRDVVPTFCAVTVYADPLRVDRSALLAAAGQAAQAAVPDAAHAAAPRRIPVCYGGGFGPDLASVAQWSGLDEAAVVACHAAATYRVFMLGFVPGFAYLGTVDPRIAMPRHETPRLRVPAGSVALAGRQTGIYPSDVPGGWQIIGRTPVRIFDPDRADPFMLASGDLVTFEAIDARAYARLDDWAYGSR